MIATIKTVNSQEPMVAAVKSRFPWSMGVLKIEASRYFFNRNMLVDIFLPKGKRIESIAVKEEPQQELEHTKKGDHIVLNIPPFKHKDKTSIVISFQRKAL